MVIIYVVGRMQPSAVQMILGVEPALPKDALEEGKESPGHEGESTAAKRLVEKMIDQYRNGQQNLPYPGHFHYSIS